ncbi:MAG: SPOR domain-containing protein [Betaproteobacteria bacterium]|nr:SPOR domain-containing protein [Betaproteobacteria bacterium]MDE2049001.1 SPOR domain-containing protein [Betaproteobacteria bacterium]
MNWRFWQPRPAPAATRQAAKPSVDEERLRVAARRRLIGAAVLVLLTVLIFPWVFQSQPRPVNDDIVIEVPRKDAARPLPAPAAMPAPAPAATTGKTPVPAGVTEPQANKSAGESAGAPGSSAPASPESVPQKPPIAAATPPADTTAPSTAAPSAVKPAAQSAATSAAATNKAADAKGRFVVQVAAYADASKARDTRLKLEKAGLKTYSQAVDSSHGRVWRVRVGPFDSRAAAEKAKAELVLQGYSPGIVEL